MTRAVLLTCHQRGTLQPAPSMCPCLQRRDGCDLDPPGHLTPAAKTLGLMQGKGPCGKGPPTLHLWPVTALVSGAFTLLGFPLPFEASGPASGFSLLQLASP